MGCSWRFLLDPQLSQHCVVRSFLPQAGNSFRARTCLNHFCIVAPSTTPGTQQVLSKGRTGRMLASDSVNKKRVFLFSSEPPGSDQPKSDPTIKRSERPWSQTQWGGWGGEGPFGKEGEVVTE